MSKENKRLMRIEELIINRNITTENLILLQGKYRRNILYIIKIKKLLTKSSQVVNKATRNGMIKLHIEEFIKTIHNNILLEEKLGELKKELELIKFVLLLSTGKKHRIKNIDPRT